MSLIPSGLSIQEAYRRFRNGQLVVNRRYQRKLVWTQFEKQMLIDSILHGYPIPLILFAEKSNNAGSTIYEILDGMQRLNAIFGFIENEFPINNKYFDINELARAKQSAEDGLFSVVTGVDLLAQADCANFLDYQLAVTSYQAVKEETVFEVFGRINSGGRRLSNQERRQAGVLCDFTDVVRSVATEIRGDSTQESVLLSNMPEISIGSTRTNDHYGLKAEEVFWVKQGILSIQNLRDSDDEEMIADIAVSILLEEPLARSKESLDELYNLESELYKKVEVALVRYTPEKITRDIKNTFSVLKNVIESVSVEENFLRKTVYPTSRSPIKNGFYTIFMAFYELLVKKDLSPYDNETIFTRLTNLQSKLTTGTHYTTTEDRKTNLGMTIGLIQEYFVKKEPSSLTHGSGLAIDFENSVRRSKIETPRYEYKQGLLRLSKDRKYDSALENQILKTICAMANISPDSESYLFIGVADKKTDADRIVQLDNITVSRISSHHVVGIDREAAILGISIEDYCRRIVSFINGSSLSKTLITSVLSNIDIIDYKNLSVIRIKVPAQPEISYFNDDVYIRQYNNTVLVSSMKEAMEIARRFK